MERPLIWLENLPRKLNFLPHLRTLGYCSRFLLTSERRCQSFQFCFRFGSEQTKHLELAVDGRKYRVGFPHLMIKTGGQRIEFLNATEVDALYFSYLPEYGPFFKGRSMLEHFILRECRMPASIPQVLEKIALYTNRLGSPSSADRLDLLAFQVISETLLELDLADTPEDENSKKIQKIVSYLQVHFCERPNFDVLARQHGFSRRSFIRHWQKTIGRPPGEYVANLRLLEAKRLLKESTLSILEIAVRLGFCDDGYFCRFFRSRTGTTPLCYRKTVKHSEDGTKVRSHWQ